jgi:arsenite/tail-anchored protein-transporting ATPase
VHTAEDPGCPILGTAALLAFGTHIFEGKKLARKVLAKPPKAPQPRLETASWPALVTPLTLTVGKGGVGKTTISAALAFHHRHVAKSESVTVCSIDPAPSLDDVFAANVGDQPRPVLRDRKLLAAEFDAMAEFQQWADSLRRRLNEAMTGEERGIHLDVSLDRKFLLSLLDVVPPGVDEIFAIFRILDLLRGGGRVVIDMAPTGHALELLRTPARLLTWARLLLKTLAAHRTLPIAQDAAVEIAKLSQNIRELASILHDPRRSRVVVVTTPEPLPDDETRRLLRDLKALDTPLGTVFVNRVLMAEDAGKCSRCNLTVQWQNASLAGLRKNMGCIEILVAPEFDEPIAGAQALKQFTSELWRIEDHS